MPNRSCSVLWAHGPRTALRDSPQRPTWARLGLTVPDPGLRERAADALAATIVRKLEEPVTVTDRNQLNLPL
ncbi:DUF6771 family protein [Sphingomonas arenae]|uniref:DUF6771 family protein n=1 Tax=Sphingomonas arenae TaxID=2812555 RepID=UPI003AF953DC